MSDRRTYHDERDQEPYDEGGRPRGSEELPAAAAARAGLRQIAGIVMKTPEGVTSVEPAGDGWVVHVEVLEARRIPSSSDVLALYEVEIDGDGVLTSYRRTRRYARGRGNEAS